MLVGMWEGIYQHILSFIPYSKVYDVFISTKYDWAQIHAAMLATHQTPIVFKKLMMFFNTIYCALSRLIMVGMQEGIITL
jgi:hypothetical protein